MSGQSLTHAVKRYFRVHALVEDQRRRVSALRHAGFTNAMTQETKLLALCEEVLEVCRQALEIERSKHGFRPAQPEQH